MCPITPVLGTRRRAEAGASPTAGLGREGKVWLRSQMLLLYSFQLPASWLFTSFSDSLKYVCRYRYRLLENKYLNANHFTLNALQGIF